MRLYLNRWEKEPSLVNAADVVDAAIISGDHVAAVPAALSIVKHPTAQTSLQRAAEQVLGQISDRPAPLLELADEWKDAEIYKGIKRLKARLSLVPRDALTAIEIARLQAQIGQHRSAKRYVERALAAAPNDRYVLRCSVRFFAHDSVKEDAGLSLKAISLSDAVRADPWVQAAELAAANLCKATPRWAVKTRSGLVNGDLRGIQYSELAAGLAALEQDAGASRQRIKKFLTVSLAAPTENALAQAIWSGREIGANLNVTKHLDAISNAYEARARTAYEVGDYPLAVEQGWQWLQDQHISPNAAMFGAFVSLVLRSDYQTALDFANCGLKPNPDHISLINSKLVALANLGKIAEAVKMLSKLETFEHSALVKPFVWAARGLIAFRQGSMDDGRRCYLAAIEASRVSPQPTLARNAAIYWLEQELFAGTISLEDAQSFVSRLDEAYATKRSAESSTVWTARKKIILNLMRMTEMRRKILRGVSNVSSVTDVTSILPPIAPA